VLSAPQTANRSSYALNNPFRYTDPSGRFIQAALDHPGELASLAVSLTVVPGLALAAWGAVTGSDPFTGRVLSGEERSLGFVIAAAIPLGGLAARVLARVAGPAMRGLAGLPGRIAGRLAGRLDVLGDAARGLRGALGPLLGLEQRRVASVARMLSASAEGNPAAIALGMGGLSRSQRLLLDRLPAEGATATVIKRSVTARDLAAMTAYTGDEFAMLTNGARRMVVRGTATGVPIDVDLAAELAGRGWRLSAHTHPGSTDLILMSSAGDRAVLSAFGQRNSLILNSRAGYRVFDVQGDW
jgi:hypothetical protein